MSAKERFSIKSFTNPSGEQVWRIQGRMPDGRRLRENKTDYADAVARRAELEVEALNVRVNVSLKKTRLSDEQLAEAEAVYTKYPMLQTVRLTAIVDEYFQRPRPPVLHKTVENVVVEFLETKKSKTKLRPRTLDDYESRLAPLRKIYGKLRVCDLSTAELEPLIFRNSDSPLTANGNRRVLNTLFRWCVRKNYVSSNPVADIERAQVDEQEPEILSLQEARSLLGAAVSFKERRLLPYVALGLMMGLRPKELARIQWQHIDLGQKLIRLGADVAKLRQRRVIEIPENVVPWLRLCVGKSIVPRNWRRCFDTVRRMAGFRGSYVREEDQKLKVWPQDVMRHTAISNHLAAFKDEGATAYWAGNSPDTVHRFYKGLVFPEDAKGFWELKPDDLTGRIIPMPVVA